MRWRFYSTPLLVSVALHLERDQSAYLFEERWHLDFLFSPISLRIYALLFVMEMLFRGKDDKHSLS
jgi:hypothetical protein